jgi:hypothetical protein
MTVFDERGSGRRSVLLAVCGALLLLMQPTESVAQTGKSTGTGKITAVLAETKMLPGDKPGHEITMSRRTEALTFGDPVFGSGQAFAVGVSDYVAGNGSHRQWLVITHPTGDKTFTAGEGMTKSTPKPGGPPEVTYEGKWWYTGGTGKFEGITGGGTYKGAGPAYEFDGQYTLKQ